MCGDDAERGEVPAFVLAAEDFDLDAEPEEGEHGKIAEALDAAAKAEEAALEAARQATEAAERLERAQSDLASARDSNDPKRLADLKKAAQEAQEAGRRMSRRLAKARAKADLAAREADELLGPQPTDESEGEASQA